MIIVTGGAGFIGSCFIAGLNNENIKDITVVDSLGESCKWKNLTGKIYSDYLHKNDFINNIRKNSFDAKSINAVFHLGACTDTTESNAEYLMNNNTIYTKNLAIYCMNNKIPFYYASSAATYGSGDKGYYDDHSLIPELTPINMYGYSKQIFDMWAYEKKWLDKITGFKFFNVFGPNEAHKKGMTSAVYNAFHEIKNTGKRRLFKSDNPEYQDGEQVRDFVYVKDVIDILLWFFKNPQVKGIFNVGTGKPASWKYITECVFNAMSKTVNIEYFDMPDVLKGKYQYHTCASTEKLNKINPVVYTDIKNAVHDYVKNYLIENRIF